MSTSEEEYEYQEEVDGLLATFSRFDATRALKPRICALMAKAIAEKGYTAAFFKSTNIEAKVWEGIEKRLKGIEAVLDGHVDGVMVTLKQYCGEWQCD